MTSAAVSRSARALTLLMLSTGLAARGESPAAFDRRCIPVGCVASPSNIPDILGRRALPAGRLAGLGATPDFHHGLLGAAAGPFDHDYADYTGVLRRFVRPPRVDYRALKDGRGHLDQVVASFAARSAQAERSWGRDERLAFWINAYNALTLRAVVDHYPIRAGWFTLAPRNSIRQIDGVWTRLTWQAAGQRVTLDDIEHRILRPQFEDARVHFALNCASISCPPLADRPYRAATLDAQLDAAAQAYLGSREGLREDGDTIAVSSIFKWYGDDFIGDYASLVPGSRNARERAILGAIVRFGPPSAAARARTGSPRVEYLDYDWSLNDARR